MQRVNAVAPDVAIVIPVKSFTAAKARLAPVLDSADRAGLARWTADRVLAAASGGRATFVVCDDDDVAAWAGAHGAEVVWQPGRGLNGAVAGALDRVAGLGFDHVTIAHADLARPHGIATIARPGTITLVPDRVLDGTNVLSFPLAVRLTPSYGVASFESHLRQALATGWRVSVVRHPLLAIDLDSPADLRHPLVLEVLPSWLPTNPVNLPAPPTHAPR